MTRPDPIFSSDPNHLAVVQRRQEAARRQAHQTRVAAGRKKEAKVGEIEDTLRNTRRDISMHADWLTKEPNEPSLAARTAGRLQVVAPLSSAVISGLGLLGVCRDHRLFGFAAGAVVAGVLVAVLGAGTRLLLAVTGLHRDLPPWRWGLGALLLAASVAGVFGALVAVSVGLLPTELPFGLVTALPALSVLLTGSIDVLFCVWLAGELRALRLHRLEFQRLSEYAQGLVKQRGELLGAAGNGLTDLAERTAAAIEGKSQPSPADGLASLPPPSAAAELRNATSNLKPEGSNGGSAPLDFLG